MIKRTKEESIRSVHAWLNGYQLNEDERDECALYDWYAETVQPRIEATLKEFYEDFRPDRSPHHLEDYSQAVNDFLGEFLSCTDFERYIRWLPDDSEVDMYEFFDSFDRSMEA